MLTVLFKLNFSNPVLKSLRLHLDAILRPGPLLPTAVSSEY